MLRRMGLAYKHRGAVETVKQRSAEDSSEPDNRVIWQHCQGHVLAGKG